MLSFFHRGSLGMQITCSTVKPFSSSSLPSPVALPAQREAHFWYVIPDEVKDPSLYLQYLNLLSPCEKENVFRMRGDTLQKGALLARTLVRTTIARYTNCVVSPSLLKFKRNTFGKPEVEWELDKSWDPPSLHFNLSHTSSLIACGVTIDTPIGIDVEEKHRKLRNKVSSFARRYFTQIEFDYLNEIPDPESQRQEFLKLWTLKEAYVKALGRGFSATPFKTFTIRFEGINGPSLKLPGYSHAKHQASKIVVDTANASEDLTMKWKFGLYDISNSHYAAICVENKQIGEENDPLKLKMWKTIPFVKDEFVPETNSIRTISDSA